MARVVLGRSSLPGQITIMSNVHPSSNLEMPLPDLPHLQIPRKLENARYDKDGRQ